MAFIRGIHIMDAILIVSVWRIDSGVKYMDFCAN